MSLYVFKHKKKNPNSTLSGPQLTAKVNVGVLLELEWRDH